MNPEAPRLILVGSRLQAYREYALAALAETYEVVLVSPEAPTWQARYVETHRIADTTDGAKLFPAVSDLRGEVADAAVVSWDEWSLVAVAEVARRLGMRHLCVEAARTCRDKYAARQAMQAAGLRPVRHGLAHDLPEAVTVADTIGYPVVVKPRSLGGSYGVTVVDGPHDLPAAYRLAAATRLPGVRNPEGVLIEEYLPGAEISVESIVLDGVAEPVFVTHKRLGTPPYPEEAGHLVGPWRHEPWADEVATVVQDLHRAVGVDWGVTHTELRLTPDGPRPIEINGRLAGDLIPHLGALATGIDLARAAAEIAFTRIPTIRPTRNRTAEIRFLYPAHGGTVQRVDLPDPADVPGLVAAVPLAAPGDRIAPPPHALTPRTAALVAVGDDARDCRRTLDRAEDASRVVVAAPPQDRLGAPYENAVTRRFLDHQRGTHRMTVSGVRGDDWFRYGAGGGEGLNRPVLLGAGELTRLEADLAGFFDLIAGLPRRLFDGDLRRFAVEVGMSPVQTDLVLRGAGPALAPLARADLYRQTDGFRLMELNTGSSLGGWQMGIFGRALARDPEFARFAADEGLTFPDPLAEIVSVLRARAPHLDRIHRPLLAITDWPEGFAKTKCWMDFVVPGFTDLGFDTVVCHLDQFDYVDGEVRLDDRRVDVVYRMFLPGEMPDEQRTYDRVEPLFDAVERGTVELFAPLDSELYGNKGSLALLSDERTRHLFTAEEAALVDRLLPWTRFLREEQVSVVDDRVDLVPYALANREQLVLKPTLLYGGVGVTPGWTVDQDEWERRIRGAVDGPYVVQQRVLPTTERFRSDTGPGFDRMAVAYGVMLIGSRYAGTLARAVPDPSVGIVSMLNGAQIGCVFHVHDEETASTGPGTSGGEPVHADAPVVDARA
ncbi:ATP-grasp domain-containing protein [Micromonospora sp. SH-82]|uniref:ATP-grasp domain-containing protein n=1 Tax=Micromonospora sp. SH-82 TaxID=3132938 RepID=UPI003EBE1970